MAGCSEMAEFIPPLETLVEQFHRLPGVGRKTAERYALSLLKLSEEEAAQFADAILGAKRDICDCRICHNISVDDVCPICASPDRDVRTLCVVQDARDVMAMERVRAFDGVYHVLGGLLNPRKQQAAEQIRIPELLARVAEGEVEEVILAINPTFERDTTAIYIANQLSKFPDVRVTRLAYGIPVGGDLVYADEVTLTRALQGRNKLN